MKKLIFTIILSSTFIFGVQAQIQRGNVMAGANISNFALGLDDPNIFRMDINPKAAWFVQDGLAIGGELNLGLSTAKNAGSDINYGVGLLGRYYGSRGADMVVNNSRFFAEATFGISGVNPSVGDNTNGLGFSFGPGFTYFISPAIGLEALLKYNGVAGFGESAYAHNLSLGVGFQIYLPGRSTARKIQKDVE